MSHRRTIVEWRWRNMNEYVRQWVWKIQRWDESFRLSGRNAWINIISVPLACRTEEVFEQNSAVWGVITDTKNCELQGNQNLIVGRVLVHTTECGLTREKLKNKAGKKMFKVMVVEGVKDIVEIDINEEENETYVDEEPIVGMDVNETDGDDKDEDEEKCKGDGIQWTNGGTSSEKKTSEDQESRRGSAQFPVGVDNFDDVDSGIKIGALIPNNNLHENNETILAARYDVPEDNLPPSINNDDTSRNGLNVEKGKIRLNVDVETRTRKSTCINKKDMDDVTETDDNSFRIIQSTEKSQKKRKITDDGRYTETKKQNEDSFCVGGACGIRTEHNLQDEINKVRFTATFGGSDAALRSSSVVGLINSERAREIREHVGIL
ncbi:hypothetical protein Tco_1195848 [Tanacetum coccineum]